MDTTNIYPFKLVRAPCLIGWWLRPLALFVFLFSDSRIVSHSPFTCNWQKRLRDSELVVAHFASNKGGNSDILFPRDSTKLHPTPCICIVCHVHGLGLSRKGYKMRSLQMPLFWFVSFVNGIKRIKDKTFCFEIWLEPNLSIQHTTRIHGARCNSTESRGIRMFEFPPLLLGKWAMTGSLSQNLFCQLQAKVEWLT